MVSRWCSCCGEAFSPSPRVPHQAYCTSPACQRERRRLWQAARRRTDPDYLANQSNAQKAWAKRNAGYWQSYREANPDYVEKNRSQQRARDAMRTANQRTGVDLEPMDPAPQSGIYELRMVGDGLAKMTVWTVQLTFLGQPSVLHTELSKSCKERT